MLSVVIAASVAVVVTVIVVRTGATEDEVRSPSAPPTEPSLSAPIDPATSVSSAVTTSTPATSAPESTVSDPSTSAPDETAGDPELPPQFDAAMLIARLSASVPIDGEAALLATAGGDVWASTGSDIFGLDPATNAVVADVPFDGARALAVGPETGPITPPSAPPGAAATNGFTTLYACSTTQTARIVVTGAPAIVDTFPFGCQSGMTAGFGSLWLTEGDRVVRLSPAGDLLATIPVERANWGVAAGAGSIWVADGFYGPGRVTRIDPSTNQVIATVAVPVRTRNIVATAAAVWITTEPTADQQISVIRIDPATNTIANTYWTGSAGWSLDLLGDHLWVVDRLGEIDVIDIPTDLVMAVPPAVGRPPAPLDGDGIVSAFGSVWISRSRTPSVVERIEPGSYAGSTSIAPVSTTPVRVETSQGCPRSVAGIDAPGSSKASTVDNPGATGLADAFVPGTPVSAKICRYTALQYWTSPTGSQSIVGGTLLSETVLDTGQARQLASSLNGIEPSAVTADCQPALTDPRYTAIAFALPGRRDVDVWLKDFYGCPEATNGHRDSGLLINGNGSDFIHQLDALAPPAPDTSRLGQ